MRDMTVNFKPENWVTENREDCAVRLYQQCFYSEGANIKSDSAYEFYAAKLRAKDRKFRDLCRLIKSMTRGR